MICPTCIGQINPALPFAAHEHDQYLINIQAWRNWNQVAHDFILQVQMPKLSRILKGLSE